MIQFELLMAKVREEVKILQNYEVICRQRDNYEALVGKRKRLEIES